MWVQLEETLPHERWGARPASLGFSEEIIKISGQDGGYWREDAPPQGAGGRGEKVQGTAHEVVVKRVENASKQLNKSSFQEAHACNDNFNKQL